jgi:spermidine/putrescine transport system permease protein
VVFLHRHRWLTPYLLLAPGLAWLAVFFVVPLGFLGYQSLQSGSFDFGFEFTGSSRTTGTRSRPTTST